MLGIGAYAFTQLMLGIGAYAFTHQMSTTPLIYIHGCCWF